MCNRPGCRSQKIYVTRKIEEDWFVPRSPNTEIGELLFRRGTVLNLCKHCNDEYNTYLGRANPVQFSSIGKLMMECRTIISSVKKLTQKSEKGFEAYFNRLAEAILDTLPNMQIREISQDGKLFMKEVTFPDDNRAVRPKWMWLINANYALRIVTIWQKRYKAVGDIIVYQHGSPLHSLNYVYSKLCNDFNVSPKKKWIDRLVEEIKPDYFVDLNHAIMETFGDSSELWVSERKEKVKIVSCNPERKEVCVLERYFPTGDVNAEFNSRTGMLKVYDGHEKKRLIGKKFVYETLCSRFKTNPLKKWIDKFRQEEGMAHV